MKQNEEKCFLKRCLKLLHSTVLYIMNTNVRLPVPLDVTQGLRDTRSRLLKDRSDLYRTGYFFRNFV